MVQMRIRPHLPRHGQHAVRGKVNRLGAVVYKEAELHGWGHMIERTIRNKRRGPAVLIVAPSDQKDIEANRKRNRCLSPAHDLLELTSDEPDPANR